MRRFALCIPAGSDGTRVLPPCPNRRWQIAGTAGQPYLVFRSLALLLRHGPATGRAATEPHHGGAARRSLRYGHGSWGRTSGSRKDVEMCGVVAEPGELAPDGIPNRERTMRDDRLLRHGMRRAGDGEGHALGQPRPDLIEHGAKASALAEGLPRPMRSGRQVRGRCGHARFSGGQLPGMTSRRWTAAP